ncbi:MAG: hypothetical protein KDK78_00325 [Chlamydiia bacterium]|nr:hypothetical protein [Chlamydiia bacterium]
MNGISSLGNHGHGSQRNFYRHPGEQKAKQKALKAVPLMTRTPRDIYIPQDHAINISSSYARDPKMKGLVNRQVVRQAAPGIE